MFHSKLFSGTQSQRTSSGLRAGRDSCARLAVERLETRDLLAVFTVTNTADAGDGSLRAAIVASNDAAGADRIEFSIGSGAQTIALQSQLEIITDQVEIDGTTQPGYVDRPLIELNGSAIGADANGISIASDGSTVRGLSIVGFQAAGIASTAIAPSVLNSWIGVRADGTTLGNAFGTVFNGTDGVVVGNVISGNSFTGIKLAGDSGDNRNRVENNIIGYDPFLSVAAPNRDGISSDGSGSDLIQGNIIGGNSSEAIIITFNGAGNNVIRGNYIGTDPSGVLNLGNFEGIEIFGFSNLVEGNIIANNQEQGVLIGSGSEGNRIVGNEIRNNRVGVIAQPSSTTPISQNSIFANQQLGIDLLEVGELFYEEGVSENDEDIYLDPFDGTNYGVNFPVINEVTRSGPVIKISGILNTFPQNSFRLEFFGSEVADPTGFGEGRYFLGGTDAVTDAEGNTSFSIDLPNVVGANLVTATSTIVSPTLGRATSEFSKAVIVSEVLLPDLQGSSFVVAPTGITPVGVATVTYEVENVGSEVSPSSTARFFLSRDDAIEATDKLLGSDAVASLAVGANSGIQVVNLPIPDANDPIWQGNGTYFIGMIVDDGEVVFESDETNNSNLGLGVDLDSVQVSGLENNVKQDTIGLLNPNALSFALNTQNLPGSTNITVSLPGVSANWNPIAGDWNKDGTDDVGLYDPVSGTFRLQGVADVTGFSPAGRDKTWLPIAGDWNGDGSDTVGLYDPATATFYLRNENGSTITPFAYTPDGQDATWLPIVGNWDGVGGDSIGLFDPEGLAGNGVFYLRNFNSAGDPSIPAIVFGEGFLETTFPVVGDWDGDGIDTIGVYDQRLSIFNLRNDNSPGGADAAIVNYGPAKAILDLVQYAEFTPQVPPEVPLLPWLPIAGDWDGPTLSPPPKPVFQLDNTIGLFNPNAPSFALNTQNLPGSTSIELELPQFFTSWKPLAGDWDNDGTEDAGLYDQVSGNFWLQSATDVTDFSPIGRADDWLPIAGDWNGDGQDTVGLYDPETAMFYLRNEDTTITQFIYKPQDKDGTWQPIAGNWDGIGGDSIGLFDPAGLAGNGVFYLRNFNSEGGPSIPPIAFGEGFLETTFPVVGDWDGDGIDTIGVYDQRLSIFNLRNDNSPGGADAAIVNYGPAKAILDLVQYAEFTPQVPPEVPLLPWLPIAGDWDGNSIPLIARVASDEEQVAPSLRAEEFPSDELAWSSAGKRTPDFDLLTYRRTEIDQPGLSEIDGLLEASRHHNKFPQSVMRYSGIVSEPRNTQAVDHALAGESRTEVQPSLDMVDQLTSTPLGISDELTGLLVKELSPGTAQEGDVLAIDHWFSRLD